MKERLLNIFKIIFIILGIIFFIILVLSFLATLGIAQLFSFNNNFVGNNANKLKEIQPIINYAQNYFDENKQYPKELGEIKIKKDIDYRYETNPDNTCYVIVIKPKKVNKTQQYQRCTIKTNNANSISESYVEFSN